MCARACFCYSAVMARATIIGLLTLLVLGIGDAAHAMSPVGGVGINLAIQDAVAAANILWEPLRQDPVPEDVLAQVQKRRQWPTEMTQADADAYRAQAGKLREAAWVQVEQLVPGLVAGADSSKLDVLGTLRALMVNVPGAIYRSAWHAGHTIRSSSAGVAMYGP